MSLPESSSHDERAETVKLGRPARDRVRRLGKSCNLVGGAQAQKGDSYQERRDPQVDLVRSGRPAVPVPLHLWLGRPEEPLDGEYSDYGW